MYESPKTIRRRQQARNEATRRGGRGPQVVTVPTDEEWERLCDFHVTRICERAEAGAHQAAGRHAQALVHAALQRRAYQIMRNLGRAYWKAMLVARHELYNCELEGD